uniref:Uncharacterized protein n=1 Tax=Leersia perrieri TaxID=77586 RepID=A0A0D9XCF8_9ORYZ
MHNFAGCNAQNKLRNRHKHRSKRRETDLPAGWQKPSPRLASVRRSGSYSDSASLAAAAAAYAVFDTPRGRPHGAPILIYRCSAAAGRPPPEHPRRRGISLAAAGELPSRFRGARAGGGGIRAGGVRPIIELDLGEHLPEHN